jgi:alcohol dehydrogenase class IV
VRLYSGSEAMPGLAREARRLEGTRVLLIAQPSCVRAGLPERIRQEAGLDFVLFSEVQRESPLPSIEAVRQLWLASNADLLLGVGGGSAIVTTRAAAILLRKEGHDVRNLLVPTTPTTAMSRSGAAVVDPLQRGGVTVGAGPTVRQYRRRGSMLGGRAVDGAHAASAGLGRYLRRRFYFERSPVGVRHTSG